MANDTPVKTLRPTDGTESFTPTQQQQAPIDSGFRFVLPEQRLNPGSQQVIDNTKLTLTDDKTKGTKWPDDGTFDVRDGYLKKTTANDGSMLTREFGYNKVNKDQVDKVTVKDAHDVREYTRVGPNRFHITVNGKEDADPNKRYLEGNITTSTNGTYSAHLADGTTHTFGSRKGAISITGTKTEATGDKPVNAQTVAEQTPESGFVVGGTKPATVTPEATKPAEAQTTQPAETPEAKAAREKAEQDRAKVEAAQAARNQRLSGIYEMSYARGENGRFDTKKINDTMLQAFKDAADANKLLLVDIGSITCGPCLDQDKLMDQIPGDLAKGGVALLKVHADIYDQQPEAVTPLFDKLMVGNQSASDTVTNDPKAAAAVQGKKELAMNDPYHQTFCDLPTAGTPDLKLVRPKYVNGELTFDVVDRKLGAFTKKEDIIEWATRKRN